MEITLFRNMHRGAIILVLGLTLILATVALVAALNPQSALAGEENEVFCSNANLGPYGSSNDNCVAGGRHGIDFVQVQARDHSACAATTTNGSKSGVNISWACTSGGGNEVVQNYTNHSICAYGIMRNNTTGSGNVATGVAAYNTEVPC